MRPRPAICEARRSIAISRGLLRLRISSRIGSSRAPRRAAGGTAAARRSGAARRCRPRSRWRARFPPPPVRRGSARPLGRAELRVDRRRRRCGRAPGAAPAADQRPVAATIVSSGSTPLTPVSRFTRSTSSADSTGLRPLQPCVARRQVERRGLRAAVEQEIRAGRLDAGQVIERVVLARQPEAVGPRYPLHHGDGVVADLLEDLLGGSGTPQAGSRPGSTAPRHSPGSAARCAKAGILIEHLLLAGRSSGSRPHRNA